MTRSSSAPVLGADVGAPDPDAAISIRGLVKRYGEFTAVDGLDLDIHRGEIFALLGPNGAGKTPSLLAMVGLVPLMSGSARRPACARSPW